MKVLVTGGGGYIGSVLVQMLLERGYKVKCLDRFFFGVETLSDVAGDPNLEIVKDDIRWFDPTLLRDVDAVMDLAALSNDPSGELDPTKTMEINYKGRVRVAKLSKKYGVERYILASSCSVYGFQDEVVDENSPTNPLTTYAKANALAERETLLLADDNFSVTVLRQATVYGLSPRMRFDLAINGMVLGFYKHGKIPIMRDGTQWRPFVHIRDTARAFITVLESERDLIKGEIFNVGSNEQNYQIKPLAELIADAIGLPFNFEWYGSPDKRSYRVDFSKIRDVLGFKPKYTPKEGAKEIYDALVEGKVEDNIKTRTVEWYKFLLTAQKIIKEVELRGVIL
ncbi:NAD-dependent dehydratase [Methanofervidicoccus sp. A16]|uniref:NAD-dependent epimerase/dehydratase family protein n=1 Tax=Methanofervidicoccus sp. A16 TaxID=2607662 RepID=UPI00118C07E6|nr:NAD(P)-dependent oxidoreductase [Methanofervidicoccus sp. A16]AXI24813.1 NAD-dependent dehydratase [Methanofervidicoccus sp. A16]